MRHRLPKAARLRKRREFLALQEHGRRVGGRYVLLMVSDGSGRLGITVSKKVGNAVTRNRVKRFVREFVRQARTGSGAWLPAHRDVVVVARPSAARATSRELWAELDRLGSAL